MEKIGSALRLFGLFWFLWTSCCGLDALTNARDLRALNLHSADDNVNDFIILPSMGLSEKIPEFYKKPLSTMPEDSAIMSDLTPKQLQDLIKQYGDLQFLASQTTFTPRIGRRKRSVEDEVNTPDERLWTLMEPTVRFGRNTGNVKTIHLSSSFVPRLGRKRSNERFTIFPDGEGYRDTAHSKTISGRSQHVINLSAGNAFTPRLGRSDVFHRLARAGGF